MIERFTEAEEVQILAWAEEIRANNRPENDRRVTLTQSSLEIDILGTKGEYAIYRGLGGARNKNLVWHRSQNDGGVDIICNGWKLQIKSTPCYSGRFYLKQGEKFVSDLGVLVVEAKGEPNAVDVVRWIGRRRFMETARWVNLNEDYPDVFAVSQSQMQDNIWNLYHMILSTPVAEIGQNTTEEAFISEL